MCDSLVGVISLPRESVDHVPNEPSCERRVRESSGVKGSVQELTTTQFFSLFTHIANIISKNKLWTSTLH